MQKQARINIRSNPLAVTGSYNSDFSKPSVVKPLGQMRQLNGRLWRTLISIRLAVVLILLTGLLCLAGVFLIQVPSELASGSLAYQSWIETVARPRYVAWTDFLETLQFLNIFHSFWFLSAGSLLMLNIACCTLNRWQGTLHIIRGENIKQSASFYRSGSGREWFSDTTMEATVVSFSHLLKRHRYRVRMSSFDETTYIAADKNRFSVLGTFFSHLSIILFVGGFLIGSTWGFNEKGFILTEGQIGSVGHETGLSLELKSFEDEYWTDGTPKDYRSTVALYSGGKEVEQALIRVNSPLRYGGISFYQSSFGPAANIQVRTGHGAFEERVPLIHLLKDQELQRRGGSVILENLGMTMHVLGGAINSADPLINVNELGVFLYDGFSNEPAAAEILAMGKPANIGDLEITYSGDSKYSVFQIAKNPGIPLIWAACALFIAGLMMVFNLPLSQVWALIEPAGAGKSRVMLRTKTKIVSGEQDKIFRSVKKLTLDEEQRQ